MSSTGVLPFVRGIDLSKNDFSGDTFPTQIGEMTGLRWLKANRSKLDKLPEELSRLKNLEHLQLIRNNLTSAHGELSDLPCLRSIILRHNQIKTSGIPTDIFNMQDLTVLDFSHNALKEVPPNLDHTRGAIVLNLSHNNIESVPNQLFVNMADLLYLDLSHNKLDMLPPQLRRMIDLQTLILSFNPLQHFHLKQLPNMVRLRVLHMKNTQRNGINLITLDNLISLEDVDFSENDLTEVPESLYKLKELRKLNLSNNQISEFVPYCECWTEIEVLNLSRNKLKALPNALANMTKLKKLFINENQIEFSGIPAGIGKLVNMEVFHAAYNNLELIPEGLCRCVKLRKIKINNNRLITVPDSIYLLSDLAELDVRNNPDLVMPPKPSERRKAQLAFYNIDFTLDHQMKIAGAASPSSSVCSSSSPVPNKDPIARKIQFLRRRKGQTEADNDQKKILKGMTEVAKERTRAEEAFVESQQVLKGAKRWDEALEKPPLDYSELFDNDAGQVPGITVWEIENFLPNPLEEAFNGKFYEGDCYIILKTLIDESNSLNWQIFYWIGERATLDKKACAAIHAVNLRNYLGASCRTQREEMNEESDEFLELFGDEIIYIEGGRTLSGFYSVEKISYPTRLYRVALAGTQIYLEPVLLAVDSLDPRYVFLLDCGLIMYLWCGKKSKGVLRTKARLFSEKMNKTERKGEAEIESVHQTAETEEFWKALTGTAEGPDEPIVEHVSVEFEPTSPRLYQVCLGMGYLELPQVDYKRGQLKQSLLNTRCVYILDCYSDLFIWIGKKSTRLVRAACSKLAVELHSMIDRPEHAIVNEVNEGTESMIFKSKFVGWDDVIAVDFTRTADSVQRRGVDLKVILERDKMKTDLASLFLDRQSIMSLEEAEQLMQECNEDLEFMEPFVLEGRKFVRLPEQEFGMFYSNDCYVFLCRYWVPSDDYAENGDDEETDQPKKKPEESTPQDDFQCVVYFWQGRDASNMGWLTFTFSLQKKFESLFKDKLEVVRMYQQQENQKFLSHFKKKFVIRRGRRNLCNYPGSKRWPEMFHTRANGSAVCTRTVQVDCDSLLLNSEFCYVLCAPFPYPDEDGVKGTVYVWIGSKADANEKAVVEEVAKEKLNREEYPVAIVHEGEEPPRFWEFIGGKKPYDNNADFTRFSRLFRCTNEKGFFVVSEKTIDFCQDDLDDDDVMILDNGDEVFLWVGVRASEVEVKLAYKAAQVYIHHMKLKQPERPRKLFVTLRGKESKRFKKCFHAWGKHKQPAGE